MWRNRSYNQWADRVDRYLRSLNANGIKASLMPYDDPDGPKHAFSEQITIGGTKEACFKVWDKQIDFIELWRMEGKGGASVSVIYLVKANVGSSEKDFEASWSAPLGSFFKSGMRPYRWEGGRLAEQLNSDFSLSNMLMPYQQAMKIRVNSENQYVMIMENFVSGYNYPAPNNQFFQAIDKIGDHIRMMAGSTI